MNIYLLEFTGTTNRYLAIDSNELDYPSYKIIERLTIHSYPGIEIGGHTCGENIKQHATITNLSTEQLGEILLEIL